MNDFNLYINQKIATHSIRYILLPIPTPIGVLIGLTGIAGMRELNYLASCKTVICFLMLRLSRNWVKRK